MPQDDPHPQDPLLLACRRLARAVDEFDEAASERLGVGRSDLRALNLLEDGPLTPATLAERLRLSRSSVTALVDRLEARGYVARTADDADRRSVKIELRPATWRAFASVYAPMGRRVLDHARGFRGERRRDGIALVDVVAAAFEDAALAGS